MIRFITYTAFFTVLFLEYVVSKECPNSDNESILQSGQEYLYSYDVEAFGEAVGTTNDRGRMKIQCDVHVRHAFSCGYSLQMQDCTLTAAGGTPNSEVAWLDKKRLDELSQFPINFYLVNGVVTKIFVDPADPLHLVNIKRGALSAFVFKLSLVENPKPMVVTDIHGLCPLEYVSYEDGIVKTSKDMLLCSYPSRKDWQFSPWSLFWNMSFIQHLINSTVHCNYKVNQLEKQLEDVYCKERHAIHLESTHNTTTAVQTNIYYHMSLKKSNKVKVVSTKKSFEGLQCGIEYEYNITPDPSEDSEPDDFLPVAETMLSELVQMSHEEIQLSTITKFNEFVAWLRTANDLIVFTHNVADCSFLTKGLRCTSVVEELSMAFFSDALVQCQTVPCFAALSELVENKALSESYMTFVLYSWTNIHFTKPEILTHVMNICKEKKESKFCWLTLGTMVKKFHRTTYPSSSKKHQEVKKILEYFLNRIGRQCELPSEYDSISKDELDRLPLLLKAIGNTGEAFLEYVPSEINRILMCVTRENLHSSIRTIAVDVLLQLKVCNHSTNLCQLLCEKFNDMLQNSSTNVELKIASYQVLLSNPEICKVEPTLADLFLKEQNSQVLSFVSSHLIYLLKDFDFTKAFPNFVANFSNLQLKNNITLHEFAKESERYSTSFMNNQYSSSRTAWSAIKYVVSYIIPNFNQVGGSLKIDFILRMFDQVIELLSVGGHLEGLEKLWAIFTDMLLDADDNKSSLIIQAVKFLEILADESDPPFQFNFDPAVVKQMEQMYATYKKYKYSKVPYMDAFVEMLGSTLNFVTGNSVSELLHPFMDMQTMLQKLHNGINYNQHRVIRVIEAYHQVPTMMGLPLNWTTNATLAYSMRSGLSVKLGLNADIYSEWLLQPSVALTFLNRMVLDFPTLTQIGIQANSSGYSSTKFKGSASYGENKRSYFKIEVPERPQKILELFRTNQIIKHNSYEDIPDWDIQRSSVHWCSSDMSSSAIGMQMCHERSYPNVTHLIKPWALMAGWCKWRLVLQPYDSDLKAYVIDYTVLPEDEKHHYTQIKLSAPGKHLKRQVKLFLTSNANDSGHDRFNMTVSDLPEFSAIGSREKIYSKSANYLILKNAATVVLSGNSIYKYLNQKTTYTETREVQSTKGNRSVKEKRSYLFVDRKVHLDTPNNRYHMTSQYQYSPEHTKYYVSLTYRNLNALQNFLENVLPPTFWENESKAYVDLEFNLKRSLSNTGLSVDLQGKLNTPKTNTLVSAGFGMEDMMHITSRFDVMMRDNATAEPMTFMNASLEKINVFTPPTTKAHFLGNLTIPLKSWNLDVLFLRDKVHGNVTSAKMIPKANNRHNNYIGWWSPEAEKLFDLKQSTISLNVLVNKITMPSREHIIALFNKATERDVLNMPSAYIGVNATITYPNQEKEEIVALDLKCLLSEAVGITRFQKDFVLSSSYHNLQLTSHSIYLSDLTKLLEMISHNSYFTHMISKAKAFYNMEVHIWERYGCMHGDFNHNVTSYIYNMKSSVLYNCTNSATNQHDLVLKFDSSSPSWDALNMKIEQVVNDLTPNFAVESMNFSNPYMHINVTAHWKGNEHKKVAVFKSVPEDAQVLKLNWQSILDISENKELILTLGSDWQQFRYLQHYTTDREKLIINMYFPNEKVQFMGITCSKLDHIKSLLSVDYYKAFGLVTLFIINGSRNISRAVTTVANDPNHPLNKVLEPALQMTLGHYITEMKSNAGFYGMMENFQILQPLFQPYIELAFNIKNCISQNIASVYAIVEERSIILWAIKYFKVQEHLVDMKDTCVSVYAHIFNMPYDTSLADHFTGSNFRMHSRLYEINNWQSFLKKVHVSKSTLNVATTSDYFKPKEDGQMAMIFGPRHVYTFDGRLYEFPEYPLSHCTYLLALDVYSHTFSVTVSSNFLHVIFPQHAISISMDNHVFLGDEFVNLPLELPKGISVRRLGNVIKLDSRHITILCEDRGQLCTMEINNLHSGGIIGLLGNADGESYNDFMLPNGTVVSDVTEFARHYEVTGESKCRKLMPVIQGTGTSRDTDICREHVSKICPSIVNLQTDFLKACISNRIKKEDEKDMESGCYIENALATVCLYKQTPIQNNCFLPVQRQLRVTHKLQVVFVLDEHRSMLTRTTLSTFRKGLEKIITAIQKQFENNGYATIQYSIVGFGGTGVRSEPSVLTLTKDIWMSDKDLINKLIKTLYFEGSKKVKPISAATFTAKFLGQDTFDSKIFIVITTEDSQLYSLEWLKYVQGYLDRNHVTMYTIASYPEIEKGKKVFGVRADGLIFPTVTEGDAYMKYPKGDLAKLTSATRGSIFFKSFVDSNSPDNYFSTFAKEIWSKVKGETNYCRECKSIRSTWWWYENECHLTNCAIAE